MRDKEEVLKEIKELDSKSKVLNEELREINNVSQKIIEERYKKADQGNGDFTEEELRYSATSRCKCGAGLAYPEATTNLHDSWRCSAILKGVADKEKIHDEGYPFTFYSIKSERQPSANGVSTRPE